LIEIFCRSSLEDSMFLHTFGRCLLLFVCLAVAAPVYADPFPNAAAAYLVKSGDTVFWSHQAERRMPPASLTKMMTALVVLEKARLDEIVTVSAAAAAQRGSRLQVAEGEKFLVGDLLAAVLIRSGNDAAYALAEHVGGSEEGFAALMNKRAAALGLRNTNFVNASGFDHPNHYSTAVDLARLAEAALADPTFRSIVVQCGVGIQTVTGERSFQLINSNKLLGFYDGLAGVKTGFTSRAGPCLVVAAERGGEQVLLVLLNSPKRWEAAPEILDRAFERRAQISGSQLALLETADSAEGSRSEGL
jgi:serine-type D-Ala-D-Ala carboxypeptidase (penicillin-binding protein 5/6)